MKWYLKCLRQYFDFKGRATNKEYWMFILFHLIMYIILGVFSKTFKLCGDIPEFYFLSLEIYHPYYTNPYPNDFNIVGLYELLTFIPLIAVSVRRLHDVNKSGWLMLSLIPSVFRDGLLKISEKSVTIGIFVLFAKIVTIWVLILHLRDSFPGPNKYGPNPKTIN